MKKFLCLMGAVLMLTACGDATSNLTSLDMDGAEKALDAKMTKMSDVSEDEMLNIYELDLSLANSYVFKTSDLSNGYVYAIIEVDETNKDELKDAMDNYFEDVAEQNAAYEPEAVDVLENHLYTSVGNYLIYIASDDNEAMYEIVKEYIS